jgi:uncharacterized damage-inducible protein DinB
MTDKELEARRYPIGRFEADRQEWPLEALLENVLRIQALPATLSKLLSGLEEAQLNARYREGSWTVRELVHHLADAHMNAFIRTKLLLTETQPTIKPYDENAWVLGKDYGFPHEASFMVLLGLHQRWSLLLLECLKEPALTARSFFHPEHNRSFTLAWLIAQYAWHGDHHLAQIQVALDLGV